MFFIRAMGCDFTHEKDFLIHREHGYDCYLALFLKSRSTLSSHGVPVVCEPGTFILYGIGSPHHYGGDGTEEYFEDFIQFECDSSFLSRLELPFDEPVHISDDRVHIDDYFHLIRSVFFRCLNDNEVIDHLMQAMLTEVSLISNSSSREIPHFAELMELRRNIHAGPELDWTVDMMAGRVHISAPYMQELYKRAFGISCINDVIECRIANAKSLLYVSDLRIEEIAARCGYKSVIHFSRQFHKLTGVSPSEWRKRRAEVEER